MDSQNESDELSYTSISIDLNTNSDYYDEDEDNLSEGHQKERELISENPKHHKYEEIKHLWVKKEGEKNETTDIVKSSKNSIELNSNDIIDSVPILNYVIKEGDEEGVNYLVEKFGHEHLFRKISKGKLPIHVSLIQSNVKITEILASSMQTTIDNYLNKAKNYRNILDEQSEKFYNLLLNKYKAGKKDESKDCLQILLKHHIITEENYPSMEDIAKTGNYDVMAIFVANGAYIGTEDKTVNAFIPVETLIDAFDQCITTAEPKQKKEDNKSKIYNLFRRKSDPNENEEIEPKKDHRENYRSDDHLVKLDYRFLFRTPYVAKVKQKRKKGGRDSVSEENKGEHDSDSEEKKEVHDELSLLIAIRKEKKLQNALKHPLLQVFLYAKWKRIMYSYAFDLTMYGLIVLLLLLIHMIENEVLDNFFIYAIFVITGYILLKEIIQFRVRGRKYFLEMENYIEALMIAGVCVISIFPLSDEGFNHWCVWIMLTASYMFVRLIGNLPMFMLYITFMRNVTINFIKVILPLSILFIAFSFGFAAVYEKSPGYIDAHDNSTTFQSLFWQAIPRTLVMATGEFDYSDYYENIQESSTLFIISANLIFLVFVFLVFLVLMSVLTGIAVGDIQAIKEEMLLNAMKARVTDLEIVEKSYTIFGKGIEKSMKPILKGRHLLKSNDRSLIVKINKPETWNIMTYYYKSDKKKCSLDNMTHSKLKNFYYEKKRIENEGSEHYSIELLKDLNNVKQTANYLLKIVKSMQSDENSNAPKTKKKGAGKSTHMKYRSGTQTSPSPRLLHSRQLLSAAPRQPPRTLLYSHSFLPRLDLQKRKRPQSQSGGALERRTQRQQGLKERRSQTLVQRAVNLGTGTAM